VKRFKTGNGTGQSLGLMAGESGEKAPPVPPDENDALRRQTAEAGNNGCSRGQRKVLDG